MGGPVNLPYRTGARRGGETIPTLRCEAGWRFDPGGTLRFGLRILGVASNALAPIIEAVARYGLALGGVWFRLAAAQDSLGRLLYDRRLPALPVQMAAAQHLTIEREAASLVRIVFLSPAVFKLDRAPTFAPEDFAARFFEHNMGRAGQVHRACSGGLPAWIEAPPAPRMVGHRLYHYELPRHSFRQDKWLDFDGVVGYIDLAGELGAVMPWARAAEGLHFGLTVSREPR